MDIHWLLHATFFQSNVCYIVPKLIIQAPIQPLILTSKSLTFLQRSDISLNSNSWPFVVVNVIQILALKPALVLEGALWEAISRRGAVSFGALVARRGLRKAMCIFRRPRSCQRQWRKLSVIINLLVVRWQHRGYSSQNGLTVESGIICLVLWYMSLNLLFNVLFQGDCLWCFYHPGKCGTRNDHVPGNFL